MLKVIFPSIFALALLSLAACGGDGQSTAGASSAPTSAPSDVATPLVVGGATLPAGTELTGLQNSCRICHSLGMVTQQRLSAATWKAEVTKMRKWGAPLPAAQQATVVAYLAKYLGPTVPRAGLRTVVTAPPITLAAPPPAQ